MTTKRFIATDMSRALKKVREELGPDAIILSSKRADKGVEVVASIEEAPSEECDRNDELRRPAPTQVAVAHVDDVAQKGERHEDVQERDVPQRVE